MQGELLIWDHIYLCWFHSIYAHYEILMSFLLMMSGGMYFCGIFIYIGVCIGEARKWSLRPNVIKRESLSEYDITLMRRIFVSHKLAAGDPVSYGQVNLLPPTTKCTLRCSDLRGLWSHIKLAYVILLFDDTWEWWMKFLAFVYLTPASLLWVLLPNLLLNAWYQRMG